MHDITVKELERLSKELKGAIVEYEFEKGLDEDEEMRNIQDNISRLYNDEKMICEMIEGYKVNDYITDDPLLNKMMECYYNTRLLGEKMNERMYNRGWHDCINWFIKINILKSD